MARLTGVPVKTIRYYSDIGLLPPAEVTGAGYRLYGAEEVWRLGLIRTLRHLDFPLESVRALLSGETTVEEAISLQREAIEGRIRHLERVGAILERAAAGGPENSLEHLHDIGEALAVEAERRTIFLAERLRDAIAGDEAPEDWRDEFLRRVDFRMPEDLEPAQAAAWVELVALVKDPGFATESRRHTTRFWETLRERGIEAAWWHERHAEIGTRARAAIERGLGPESDEVQGIVDDYVVLYARAMGERPTADFARRLAEMVSGWVESVDPKTRRFWELLALLDVEDLISSQDSVNELILEGLRRRAGA